MITILIDKAAHKLGQDMFETITKTRQDVKHFFLEEMDIKPCYACRGCEEKTYGRCIVRDDADLILPYLACSKTIVVLTPIVFGGYSYQTKLIIDKIGLIGDKHYYFNNGELVKGPKNSGISYYVVGIHDGGDNEEIQVFKEMVAETLSLARWAGQAIVLPYDIYGLAFLIASLMQEAGKLR